MKQETASALLQRLSESITHYTFGMTSGSPTVAEESQKSLLAIAKEMRDESVKRKPRAPKPFVPSGEM